MNYFAGLREQDAIKKRYKELSKANHPDLGGDVEAMKAINAQYEQVMRGAYQAAGKTSEEAADLWEQDKVLQEKLFVALGLPGVEVELCGSWVWVTGETRAAKEVLKAAGFMWAHKKKAWYFRKEEDRVRNFRSMDLDEIRQRHGSQPVRAAMREALAC
jgi:hypothetical protein